MSAVMAASAATAYDQAQDAGGSESSDLELDDAPDQLLSQLPNSDDFGAALGQRGTVLRAHPLQVGSRVSCRAGLFDGATAKWSELTFGAGGSEERVYGWVSSLSDDGRRFKVDWDISVPTHDPRRASNANSLGRSSFSAGMLQRHDPRAGMRDVVRRPGSLARPSAAIPSARAAIPDGAATSRSVSRLSRAKSSRWSTLCPIQEL